MISSRVPALLAALPLVWLSCVSPDRPPLLTIPPETPDTPNTPARDQPADVQALDVQASDVLPDEHRTAAQPLDSPEPVAASLVSLVGPSDPCPPSPCVDRRPATTARAALVGTWCSCHGDEFHTFSKSGFRSPDGKIRKFTLEPTNFEGWMLLDMDGFVFDVSDPRRSPGLLRVRFVDVLDVYYRSKSDDCACFAEAQAQGQ